MIEKRGRLDVKDTVSNIGIVNLSMLMKCQRIHGPILIACGKTDVEEADREIGLFDCKDGEEKRTVPFFSQLWKRMLFEDVKLYDVHKAIIFTETFSALDLGEENIASLTISGKTDGLVVQCIPGALDVMEFLAVIESIACIELKTNTAITSQQSFNQAVTELILLSLKSRYKVFTVLTDGQDWYFLFLVKSDGVFLVEYERFSGWADGAGRLRHLLKNFKREPAYRFGSVENCDGVQSQLDDCSLENANSKNASSSNGTDATQPRPDSSKSNSDSTEDNLLSIDDYENDFVRLAHSFLYEQLRSGIKSY